MLYTHTVKLEVIYFFNWYQSLVHSEKIKFLSVILFDF
jgi:hypothetical protein